MKLWKKIGVVLAVSSSAAYATNGDLMIGTGAVSRAMGGVGTAISVGAESALKNPALLKAKKEVDIEFAATQFTPSVSAVNKTIGSSKERDSAADSFTIPHIGIVSKINENINFGLGMYGTAGLGTDYRDESAQNGLFAMSTSLSLFTLAPAVSYKVNDNFLVGLAVPVTMGQLSISYNNGNEIGRGSSQGMGTAFDLGLAYMLNDLTIGFNHKTQTEIEYNHQHKNAATDFGAGGIVDTDTLTQPTETTLGLAYNLNKTTIALDYKMIGWGDAEGYKEFGWENQTVTALGIAHNFGKFVLRLGYSAADKAAVADDALKQNAAAAPNNGQALNLFNNLGFPATVKTHMSLGGTYMVSEGFDLNFAYVTAPEEKTEAVFNGGGGDMTYETKHSQSSFTIGGNWYF